MRRPMSQTLIGCLFLICYSQTTLGALAACDNDTCVSPAPGHPTETLQHLQKLQELAKDEKKFSGFMGEIFGGNIEKYKFNQIRNIFAAGAWQQLPVAIATRDLPPRVVGAFSRDSGQIYLSAEHANAGAYLEELGHWIDQQLHDGRFDTPGDEGELFRRALISTARPDADGVRALKHRYPEILAENDMGVLRDGTLAEFMLCSNKRVRKSISYAQLEDAYVGLGCFDDDDDNTAGTPVKQQKIKGPDPIKYAETLTANVKVGNYANAKVVSYTGSFDTFRDAGIALNPPELRLRVPAAIDGTLQAVSMKFKSNANGSLQHHLEALATQWEDAVNVKQQSEVVGETVTTQAILEKYPTQANLTWGFNSKSSTGIDQVWKIQESASSTSYLFAEAKGGSSGLAADLENANLFDQMSTDWIVDRLVQERSEGTVTLARQVMADLGIKYQGYGFFKKDSTGKWVVNGKENYVFSYRNSASSVGIKSAVVREKFGASATFQYDGGYHGTTKAPKVLTFKSQDWVTKAHIPDHVLGSTHQMLVDVSKKYKAVFDSAIASGDITVEMTVGQNPNDRVSLWNPETRTIHINKSDITKPGVATKFAGELSLEMANAAHDIEYKQVFDEVKSGAITTADEYARAVMEIEHQVIVSDFAKIEEEVALSGLFKATGPLKSQSTFNQLDPQKTFDEWFDRQNEPRADGKPSLVELYKAQFNAVKNGTLSSHLIRKPATTIAADLQEIRTPSHPDPEVVARETFAMEDAYGKASALNSEFLNAIQEGRWEDADILRRQADYLISQHTATLNVLAQTDGIDALTLDAYKKQNLALRVDTTQYYQDHVVAIAEQRVTQAAEAHAEVEMLLAQASEARARGHYDTAEKSFDLAVQTQAKQEALLKSADKLASEIASAKEIGILDNSFPINSDRNWLPVDGQNDFDNTGGGRPTGPERPQFINDAIDSARTSRAGVNTGVLRNVNDQLVLVKQQIDTIDQVSEAGKMERLAEAIQIYQDSKRSLALLEGRIGATEPEISPLLTNIETSVSNLELSLQAKNVEFGEVVTTEVNTKFVTAAQNDAHLAGLLGEGGNVHTAFKYGGKLLMVVGAVSDGLRIVQADDKLGAAVEVAGGWGGALAGAAAAEQLVAPVASWFGPVGWVVDGVAGLAGGGAGYWAGSSAASALYGELKPHHDVDDPLTNLDRVIGNETSLIQPFDFQPFPSISKVALYHPGTRIQATDSTGISGEDQGEIMVSLVNKDGNPVPNVAVKFVAITGRARLITVSGKTNASGQLRSKVEDSYEEVATFIALFDSTGDGVPNTSVVNGSAEVAFAVGG